MTDSRVSQGERCEVLIVGAGASGAVAAKLLAESGVSVVCLEQGDWARGSVFTGDRPEWELSRGKTWHPNPNVRAAPADYPVNTDDSDMNPVMFNGVGGSTVLWAAGWGRATPSDFRVRTLDGAADDWPFSYQDLVPWYERVERDMGVSGLGGNPAYPDGLSYPLPPLPIGKVGRTAAQGMHALGWHWWPGTNAIPSREYRHRPACLRYGTCMTGCPAGAKASTDLTHWPDALAAGARLETQARVHEITVNRQGLATGAVYTDRDGVTRQQLADVVILAANGVGTPRLLLASTSAAHPDGLANSSGLVGRNLMIHPCASVTGTYEQDLESWYGPAGQALESMEFYETDLSRGFVRGAKWDASPSGGPFGVYEDRPAEDGSSPSEWGTELQAKVTSEVGRSFVWAMVAEDLPDPENRVTLDPELTDGAGVPAPKVTYRLSENTRRILDFNLERAREAHEAAGAVATSTSPLLRDGGWHLMGTARMGKDPETSVVDEWGRCHDVPNLYVIDGSVFVTSSGINPTATIMAVALRSASHLVEERRFQETAR